jgi:nucleolar MIF4G domain-containing protein 1
VDFGCQPVDFTILKPRTSNFLKDLFTHLFIATQVSVPAIGTTVPTTRNQGAVEEVFIKAMRLEALALGLIYFLQKEMSQPKDRNDKGLISWATRVAVDTLRTGMDLVPNL